MQKVLPRDITSYDLIKTAALVLMIVDHLGFFFFPNDPWLRVFGRMCVPIWFFLIGYAHSRDVGPAMWLGMIILQASNVVAGIGFLPVNVLGTMILIRLTIDPIMRHATQSASRLWGTGLLLLLLSIPSSTGFEYGTLAFVMAIYGYFVRHRDRLKEPGKIVALYFLFALTAFTALQAFVFHFNAPQMIVLSLGITTVMGILYFFQPVTFPRLTEIMPRPMTALLRFTGRHTLALYVAHLLLFKGLAMHLEPARFVPFHFQWLYSA